MLQRRLAEGVPAVRRRARGSADIEAVIAAVAHAQIGSADPLVRGWFAGSLAWRLGASSRRRRPQDGERRPRARRGGVDALFDPAVALSKEGWSACAQPRLRSVLDVVNFWTQS